MKKETAQKIVDKIDQVGRELFNFMELVHELSDEKEKDDFKNSIYDMVDIMNREILSSVVRQYPDLHPDREYLDDKKKYKEASEQKKVDSDRKRNSD